MVNPTGDLSRVHTRIGVLQEVRKQVVPTAHVHSIRKQIPGLVQWGAFGRPSRRPMQSSIKAVRALDHRALHTEICGYPTDRGQR